MALFKISNKRKNVKNTHYIKTSILFVVLINTYRTWGLLFSDSSKLYENIIANQIQDTLDDIDLLIVFFLVRG